MALLKNLSRPFYWLICQIFRIPTNPDEGFEEFSKKLTQHHIKKTCSDDEQKIISSIKDDTIINFKGEHPEHLYEDKKQITPRVGNILQMKHYYVRIISFIKKYSNGSIASQPFLDVGATDALLFEYLGEKGKAVNVSEGALKQMQQHGIDAEFASAENLPFKDNEFENVLCLNTLGHIENPIKAMREMKRVCRGTLFVSAGNFPEFAFLSYQDDEVGIHRWNKFSWTYNDFHKLAEFVEMDIVAEEKVVGYSSPRGLREWLFQLKWKKGKSYYIYALRSKDHGHKINES